MTHRREIYIVLAILAVAAFFRLYKLDVYPPGLYPDEAMNGNNAVQSIETGNYKIFYPENNGREGLFIALQTISIRIFGATPYALRVVSAIAGILTVLGLYLLTRKLFNWQVASIASFLLAVLFWHVVFSRMGFRAIMAPLLVTWGTYFFWKAIATSHLRHFVISGLLWGLGFYTYISFRIMPLMLVFAVLAYWHAVWRDTKHKRYLYLRLKLIEGFALFMLVLLGIVLPLAWHFYVQPQDFLGRLDKVSVFSQGNPILTILKNTVQTLGMFNFVGDHNWRHNFSGKPELFLPIGIFFVLGFFKSILRLVQVYQKHRHFPPVHVLLLSWFGLGLLPVILSTEGIPHALRAIIVTPVVCIFAAEGLWWMFEYARDEKHGHRIHIAHSNVAVFALVTFLLAIGGYEFKAYFYDYAPRPEVRAEFNQNYVDVAHKLLALPQSRIKYLLVNRDTGVAVNGIPVTAQTVMFITDTYTPEKQRAKNLYYLTPEQYARRQYLAGSTIVPLEAKK